MLTDEEYVEKGGSECPVCGYDWITVQPIMYDVTFIQPFLLKARPTRGFAKCDCAKCGSDWIDVYNLTGYVTIRGQVDRATGPDKTVLVILSGGLIESVQSFDDRDTGVRAIEQFVRDMDFDEENDDAGLYATDGELIVNANQILQERYGEKEVKKDE